MDTLLFLGIVIIGGYAGGKLSNRFKFPAVIGYLLMGLILGPSLLNILKLEQIGRMDLISDIALGIVAFTIGSELRIGILKRLGRGILTVILLESFFAFFVVFFLTYFFTHKIYLALLLGAMAPASAPAGTIVVLQEYKAKGPLTNALLMVVGLDDAFAIIIYTFAACLAKIFISQQHVYLQEAIGTPIREVIGALILGGVLGAGQGLGETPPTIQGGVIELGADEYQGYPSSFIYGISPSQDVEQVRVNINSTDILTPFLFATGPPRGRF